ncbi:flagellar basal body M-ring protein FliF [Clostridium botulinum]|uniref:flagellar basal-body MS-ring/collar protein FliF n=1 Tax=Clostridium TaxID=1485 RepID=UPI000505A077|nr:MULTISPECIES: flagellar basal-body MS-ring/collar protein FliF [unclassified Clostridium]AIY79930.1 flagellar M-ring protein FliF [Clostridium botulinum 202F]KAI3348231.1 flagellar M-ring protein FliF [Clostridium botulinum]KFX54750.1 flagellar MS-ring protein [Clostridium botulinum]KFX58808.1 flagellar MS-ring protein [Clostridium botulinum]KON12936.1 flagellar MS-ring protein [Clostridium botulinum]
MNKLLEKVKGLWEKFKTQSKKIKIAIFVSCVAVIIAIASTAIYTSSNKYQVLFSNLDPKDAQTILAKLNEQKVTTKIQGDTILVPNDKVDQLRLELAPELKSGSSGYELMDSGSSFGMTDEEFKVKKLRMQEGELEKTIKSFSQIESARVHITPSTDSVFVKESTPGKAAVYLELKTGSEITKDQVKSIVALVSGSTENVPKENIEVIDDKMNLLTANLNDDENEMMSSESLDKQYSLEKNYESKLQKEIVSLLEPVIGKDKVKATVNVDLDFDSKQQTQTVLDPNKVVVSQQTIKEVNNTDADGNISESPVDNNISNTTDDTNNTKSNSSREEQKNNYEIGKTETKVISAPGEVKRMTASVVVDGNLDAATQQAIENAVSNAIGFNSVRGDQISVLGMNFDPSLKEDTQNQTDAFNAEAKQKEMQKYMIMGAIALLALIVIIVILVKKRRKNAKDEYDDDTQLLDVVVGDEKEPEIFEPIEFETKNEKIHMENEIKKYATDKPEQVVEIIKSWLSEDER